VIDDEPIGAGGMRALMTAVLGTGEAKIMNIIFRNLSKMSSEGPLMKNVPYKLLKSIRIWRSFIGDDGAAPIVIASTLN